MSKWLDEIQWNEEGLIPAIAQEQASGRILMMAWMNRESLELSLKEGRAIYWSRSRNRLWRKGEESGNTQILKNLYLDCDGDTLVLEVQQEGGIACHTGRESCFYRRLENGSWKVAEGVIRNPEEMYGK